MKPQRRPLLVCRACVEGRHTNPGTHGTACGCGEPTCACLGWRRIMEGRA